LIAVLYRIILYQCNIAYSITNDI